MPSEPPNMTPPQAGVVTAVSPSSRWGHLIVKEKSRPKFGARCAESAGETTAECAVVFCCCPCGIANLLFIVAVKLPAGLVRRALGRKRKLAAGFGKKKARFLRQRVGPLEDDDLSICSGYFLLAAPAKEACPSKVASAELLQLEEEMSARFYNAGFWRSPSQRE